MGRGQERHRRLFSPGLLPLFRSRSFVKVSCRLTLRLIFLCS